MRVGLKSRYEPKIRYQPVATATSPGPNNPKLRQPTPRTAGLCRKRLPERRPEPRPAPRAPARPESLTRRRARGSTAQLGAGPGPAPQAPDRRFPRTLAALRVHQAVGDGVGERQQLLGLQQLQQVPAARPLPLAQPRGRHGRPARCSARRRLERAARNGGSARENGRGAASVCGLCVIHWESL